MKTTKKVTLSLLSAFFSASLFAQPNYFPTTGNAGVGVGAAPPIYPFQVNGTIDANAQGWNQGIVMTNNTALYWDGAPLTNNDYFMAHASGTPLGDFYQGYSNGIGAAAAVNYASKVYVTNPPIYIPLASTQNFKNFLVQEDGSVRRVGVNVLDPARVIESFMATEPQLRLTQDPGAVGGSTATGVYTDFQTTDGGHLNIAPRLGATTRNVGIDLPLTSGLTTSVATQKLDVNGNARLRSIPSSTANYLITGITTPAPNGIGPNDVTLRKLAFNGSTTQVLLGNGTWGNVPSGLTCANNGLSINGTGTTCIQLGQLCSELGDPGKLLSHRQIPMEKYNIFFTGQANDASATSIGLGYNPCTTIPAKFSTLQQYGIPNAVPTTAGSFVNKDQLTTFGNVTGVMGVSDQAQSAAGVTNIGGDFRAANALQNLGISADAAGGPGSAGSIGGQFTSITTNPGANIGVAARGMGGTTNTGINASGNGGTNSFGVYAIANSATNSNTAVYATAGGGTESFAVYGKNTGFAPNHWAGYFQGDVMINGNGFLTGMIPITSDKRFKKNINEMKNVSEKIAKIKSYTYEFKTEEFKEKNFAKGEQFGFIAQELKEEFPQLVVEGPGGYNYVNYIGMIPVLLEAIKEQHQQIEELKALVKGSFDNSNINTKTFSSVTLNDAQVIVLEQNVPNPFAEQTSITYNLTEGVQKAQILFYNADGKLINTSDLRIKAGQGQLNVFASDLSNGVYTYTLVVDGNVIESKRMIKSK